jgi:pimeloyl-ACP methyl ester carboxylesterase
MGRRSLALFTAIVLAVSGCAAFSGSAATAKLPSHVKLGPDGVAFYDAPPVPSGAKAGDLIWARPLKAPAGSVGYAILYWSTAVTGKLVPVSGVFFHPTGQRPSGPLPILAWAHGTFGLGDECAPSRDYLRGGGASLALVRLTSRERVAFVATDYEGLGTPGSHPYMVNEAAGRNVLDSIRAAARFTGAGTNVAAMVMGQSQGGSAALFAAELQPTYAPELRLRGAVGVSAPSQMGKLDSQLSGGHYFGYVLMTVYGYEAAYPELAGRDRALTAAGRTALQQIPSECGDKILADFDGRPEVEFGVAPVMHAPDFSGLLARNDPGQRKTGVPILVVHGEDDDTIPVQNTRDLVRRYCSNDTTVTAKFYPGKGHVDVLNAALPDIVSYLSDRLADKPAESTCGSGGGR